MSQLDLEYGFCQCGCGRRTKLAEQSSTRLGWVKGEPKRFVLGHGYRKHAHGWRAEDRGYETPCWIWNGALTPLGYAKRGTTSVYREMWEHENGPVPAGLELDHLCRQTSCIRPSHLEAVTHAVNLQRSSMAKLTPELAEEIRNAEGSLRQIGQRFGIHHTTVLAVKQRKTWR